MFTHLHLHTEFSLLDGLSRIPDVMDRVAMLGQQSVAMTDHGAMYGAIDFYKEARARGIKPIIGMEAYIAPESRTKKSGTRGNEYFHLTLLAKNEQGYRNLIQLSSKAHLEGFYYKPRMDKELLAEYGKGIIALSGCPSGEMHRMLSEERADDALKLAGFFKDVFDDFYLEVMKHDEPEINAECARVLKGLQGVSKKMKIPLVATNDSHYTAPEDHSIHDVLLCIGTNSVVNDPKRGLKMNDHGYYVKSEQEMLDAFPEMPEAVTNTQLVADQCDLELEFGRLHLPEPEIPPKYTPHSYLTHLSREGLNRKYPFADDAVRDRLQYELDVVETTRYTNYFLVVHDIAEFCKRAGIMLGVRGSAAASIILYALDVTFIDPLAHRLVFERFLHDERKDPPDVDLDIPDNRRDEVIQYVAEKYGHDHVAQIITFGTMKAKAAVRDVGRALGMSYGDVDRVARVVPNALDMTLDKALVESPELATLYETDNQVRELVDTAKRMEGVARHASTHAAGVVISREPLAEHVPLQRPTGKNEGSLIPTTQYAMAQVAEIGLLKMDFLGLANLTILGEAVDIIERTHGVRIDLQTLEDGDARTMEMLSRGETFGVFQLESPGMRRAITELRPDNTAELMALVALYRPGPMQHIGSFCRAKHDRSQIKYPHPDLAEILDETYGVITYQDQVLMVMQKIAGYSLKDGDAIRKAMSKKVAEAMRAEGEKFVAASIKNGYSEADATAIFQLIEPFAGYAFNKAHSAVYGTIAYQTAYLKANYPHEYLTAVLSAAGAHERIAEAVAECVRLGIEVLPPDINSSELGFALISETPAKGGDATADSRQLTVATGPVIRFGLGTVKNVGHAAAEGIVTARHEGGAFTDIEDFIKRIDLKAVNKRALESLIKAGALDPLGDRGTLLANIDRIVSLAQRELKLKESGQSTMFDMFGDNVATPLPALEMVDAAVTKAEMLSWEKELLGVYVSEHPFSSAAATTSQHVSALVSEITPELDGREVVIAGMVQSVRHLATKAGKPFIAVMIEDLSGTAEVTVWSDVYEPTRDIWSSGNILLMLVGVRERNDRLQASVREVSLVQAADGTTSHEQFAIPTWLTKAVRDNAGVSVARVAAPLQIAAPKEQSAGGAQQTADSKQQMQPEPAPTASTSGASAPPQSPSAPSAPKKAPSTSNGNGTKNGTSGNGAASATIEAPVTKNQSPPTSLRFVLHESDDSDADRERLDALIELIRQHPGRDTVRLFIHGHDGDKFELTLDDAAATDDLRAAGIDALGPGGSAEPLTESPVRNGAKTRGIEPLEV